MCKNCLILGIETSCDDTSISLFQNNKCIDVITNTDDKDYRKYGGIIPEIASRYHEYAIDKIFKQIIEKNNIDIKNITHIAYTSTPGLPGSLHVGKMFAKTLAFCTESKLVPIDHMMGHAFSYAIDKPEIIKFPLLSLVISGGNTILYYFKSLKKFKIINQTTDDAIGECLDKIGRAIGFDYPGGISLDKNFVKEKANMKTIKHMPNESNFSFSGIKSFATNYVNNHKNEDFDKVSLGSSCLLWCVETVVEKIKYYAEKLNINNIAIGGGVAANALLNDMIKQTKLNVFVTPKKYCGDNAAMIAFYASLLLCKNSKH